MERTYFGPMTETLYVEFIVGAAETGAPDEPPDNRLLIFAKVAPENQYTNGAIEDAGSGLPAGEVLFTLVTPEGLAIESADGSIMGHESGGSVLYLPSFDELLAAVERWADVLP